MTRDDPSPEPASTRNSPADAAASLASSNEMGHVARQLSSRIGRLILSPSRRRLARRSRELRRRLTGAPHRVDYFHQVDDAYAHLAAQALDALRERYAIELRPQLVEPELGPNQPEPELLASLARRDAAAVAPHYALEFDGAEPPAADATRLGQRILAAAAPDSFGGRAVRVGQALWRGDKDALEALASELGTADEARTARALAAGNRLREKLGHYSGAMFHYAGEWYWGVDRLYHLEARLQELGAANSDAGPRFPRPEIPMHPVPDAARMQLEVYPSLRSPYTAIGFEKALALAEATGVQLEVRPVLPMVMRGVPVTFRKGLYIMQDTKRESETLGVDFGRMIDPIGEPVRRAYSLWPWAKQRGAGNALLAAFLRAAFAEGVDTSRVAGLRQVVETAGLPWLEAAAIVGDRGWEAELEANRLTLYEEMGLWGVPSFRLRGPAGEPDFSSWGQDRLWLLAREIQRRGQLPSAPPVREPQPPRST